MAPDDHLGEGERDRTLELVRSIIADAGASSRTYKSALFFAVPGDPGQMREATRDLMAWQKLLDPAEGHDLDDAQRENAAAKEAVARLRVREAVWHAYHVVCFLGEDGQVELLDLGLLDPSAAKSLTGYIDTRLTQQDILVPSVSASWLARHRPPALPEWSLRTVRELFYSSPRFPRLRDWPALRNAVSLGVQQGLFGLAARDAEGRLVAVHFKETVPETEIEFTAESVLITPEAAEAWFAGGERAGSDVTPEQTGSSHIPRLPTSAPTSLEPPGCSALIWRGTLVPGRWMLFYNRVLSKVVLAGGLTVRIEVESRPDTGLTPTQVADVRQGLADLELQPPEVIKADE
jgi:hypothetical protein